MTLLEGRVELGMLAWRADGKDQTEQISFLFKSSKVVCVCVCVWKKDSALACIGPRGQIWTNECMFLGGVSLIHCNRASLGRFMDCLRDEF